MCGRSWTAPRRSWRAPRSMRAGGASGALTCALAGSPSAATRRVVILGTTLTALSGSPDTVPGTSAERCSGVHPSDCAHASYICRCERAYASPWAWSAAILLFAALDRQSLHPLQCAVAKIHCKHLCRRGRLRDPACSPKAWPCWRVQGLVRRILDHMKGAPPQHGSIADLLLRTTDPATGRPLRDAQLRPEIAALFFAGVDTTGHTGAFCL